MFDLRPTQPRQQSQALVLAMILTVSLTAILRGDEVPKAVTGEVRLGSGRVAGYTIHLDRNSLRDSLRVGDGLIALTSSGTLLRFELPAIRLVRERIAGEEITCIGRGEGGTVLAGLRDGRVCRVDPTTLDLTDIVKLPAAPKWVGWRPAAGKSPAGLLAVTTRSQPREEDGRRWNETVSTVHDLAAKTNRLLGHNATTFLLDRAGRLWLGADEGEWGGWVARLDMSGGTVVEIKPPPDPTPEGENSWDGVYGFVEKRDGQVLAFGGTAHMGMNSGFITRVDQAQPRRLFAFEPPKVRNIQHDPSRPRLPITHVIEENGGLLVLSYSDVFRADSSLGSWNNAATLKIGYRWGRPDAVGAYPSVCAVHPPGQEGGAYLFATVGDGYVSLEGAKATSHGIPGQLGASGVYEIKNTSEGTFFFEYDDRLPFWRLGSKGWEIASLAPPPEADPQSPTAAYENRAKAWYETRVLVGPAGSIYTVSGVAIIPGTRTTARRLEGKPNRIGRETSSLTPSGSFLTADGTLWNAFFGELNRFEKGRWQTVARLPEEQGPSGDMKPLNQNGPPWLLLDHHLHNLWRLDHGASGDNPRLSRVDLRDAGKTLRIDDAIPWSDGAFLVATDAGLRRYDLATLKLSRIDLPEPPQPATRLIRDGRGRLWLGGQGLWLVDAATNALESLERVPWIGRSPVYALALDPDHDDAVIVALGRRGVAFVRAGQKP